MGCTSSAANTTDSPTGTSENLKNNFTSAEDSGDLIEENENNYSNGQQELVQKLVHPECEHLNNPVQVDRNINITDTDKRNPDNMDVTVSDIHDATSTDNNVRLSKVTDKNESSESEENLLSLKDVVERVILDNAVTDKLENSNVIEDHNASVDIEEILAEATDKKSDEDIDSLDGNVEESTSPTQSEDSRATRWEALADIAAELPPSLAVDPLTGQIYSLTK